jgi:hypothetical protein
MTVRSAVMGAVLLPMWTAVAVLAALGEGWIGPAGFAGFASLFAVAFELTARHRP